MTKRLLLLLAIAIPHATYANCYVASGNLDFGWYDPSSMQSTTSLTTIDIRCDEPTSLTIELDSGAHSLNQQQRRMANETMGNEFLNYSLTQDAARTRPWGQIHQGTALTTGVMTSEQIYVYGVIPALQQPWLGHYSDQVTLTILP